MSARSFVVVILFCACHTARVSPADRAELGQDPVAPTSAPEAKPERLDRISLVLANTVEGQESDFTVGLEYERRIHEHWGLGALVDRFQGAVDETLVAASIIYHPIPQVGMAVNPGYQFRDGEAGRMAVRIGMFYDFEVNEWLSIAPVIYTDYLVDGTRAAILGFATNIDF